MCATPTAASDSGSADVQTTYLPAPSAELKRLSADAHMMGALITKSFEFVDARKDLVVTFVLALNNGSSPPRLQGLDGCSGWIEARDDDGS
jgi:hypothetical protein